LKNSLPFKLHYLGEKKIVVKKRFVAKHLSETFEKIKMGEEREIIVTWSRASTIIPSMVGHTIIMGFYPVRFLKKIQNSYIFLYQIEEYSSMKPFNLNSSHNEFMEFLKRIHKFVVQFFLESFPNSLESEKFQDSRDIKKKGTKKLSRMEKLESVLFDVISGLKTLDSDDEKLSTFQIELMFATRGIQKILYKYQFVLKNTPEKRNYGYLDYLCMKYNRNILLDGIAEKRKNRKYNPDNPDIFYDADGLEKDKKKPCREFWKFFEIVSHLRTMENEEEFHTYGIRRFFMPRVSKRLREFHIQNIQDLIDFPDMDYRIFWFSKEELREFHLGVWNVHAHFSNKQHCKKAMAVYGHPSKSIPLDKLIPLVQKDFLAKDLLTLESILMDMGSRLRKMENENEFLNLLIEEFFSRSVSELLKKSGISNMKDLIDFDNIYNLVLPFPKKERHQFEIQFSRLYSFFSLLEAIKNRKL